jgi:methylase of polypeptide subunit release factors
MSEDDALLTLLRRLQERHYKFVTPTPATHRRVVARADRTPSRSITDVLGWNLPFTAGSIAPDIEQLLRDANALDEEQGLLRSRVRVSSLQDCLYLHSAFPTDKHDAVFFGPDSYRFANLIAAELADCDLGANQLIVDVGTGAGVGAIVTGRLCRDATVAMTDVNPEALRFANINAAAAGLDPIALLTDRLEGLDGTIDLAVANPPYIIDDQARLYRHGGGLYGGQVTQDMTAFILPRLAPMGRLILYSGSAIIAGSDHLGDMLRNLAETNGCTLRYHDIDPDIFGEELGKPAYQGIDRIALIAAIFQRR